MYLSGGYMGGISNFEKNVYNKRFAEWVRGFLFKRCIVQPNRWELFGDLYVAYKEYANTNSVGGWNLNMPHNRFSRCLKAVFEENKWFYERIITPDGKHRVLAGLCLKENSTKRAPEDLYKSMSKLSTPLIKGSTLAEQLAKKHQNTDNDQLAVEAPAPTVEIIKSAIVPQQTNQDSAQQATEDPKPTDRDALAKQLWDKG